MRTIAMRAHGGPEVLEPMDLPDPVPGPGEVCVAVHACAINHLDLFVRRGIPGLKLPLPHVGGSDIAGTIASRGPSSGEWRDGDRVLVNPLKPCERCEACEAGEHSLCPRLAIIGEHVRGGFAEYVVVPASNLVALPDAFSFEESAAVPLTFQTAWRALFGRARLGPGESILILGASGGVAVAAIQMARLAGATVYAVTGGADKVARTRALGADVVIDRTTSEFATEVWKLTGKRGVDVVLENVGSATWKQSLRALGRGGRLVTFGATTGAMGEIDLTQLFWKQITIMGSTMASRAEFRRAIRLFLDGRVKPVVDQILPLERLREAHERLEGSRQFGKIVLRVRES